MKPQRDANNDRSTRENWWRFGETGGLRPALEGLPRYMVTVETAKHRFFTFLDAEVAPDKKMICIATDAPPT